MQKFIGLGGAKGQELMKAVVFERKQAQVEKHTIENPEEEIARFEQIRKEYDFDLGVLYEKTKVSLDESSAGIFKAYAEIVNDDFFFKKPLKMVREENVNIDYAIELEKERVSQKFAKMDDPYMKERATDITNVCDELIRRLNGITGDNVLQTIKEPFLVVAEDLTPEDTVRIDKTYLGGFITEKGGITSHAVILAKTLGIPAVVGTQGIMQGVETGDMLYINGNEGYALVNPDEHFSKLFMQERAKLEEEKQLYNQMAGAPAVSKDGREVLVCINSGDSDSIGTFNSEACDGIGLFRTEFLFMGQHDYPSEELQFDTYKNIAEKANGKEVIIRTLDIGGDKQLDYMDIPEESNPFLGYRAIRICLDRKEMFQTQLRAILRASAFGYIKIMFPMIVTCEEFLQAKAAVEEAKASLKAQSIAFDEGIKVGIMVETPASVFISDQLAKHVDFFSIGTNDLIQYITATDRMNEKVQYLYDPCNLSVLRAIRQVIQNAHAAGIPVGMCGEMASDERLTPLLFGMGLDEFSMVPSQVGRVKYMIGKMNYQELQTKVDAVLNASSIEAAKKELEKLSV